MGNGYIKGDGVSYGDSLAAFDRLPPTAREALRNAAFDWSACAPLRRWRKAQRGFKTGKEIAERVEEWDRKQHRADVKRGIVPPSDI